MDDKDLLTMQKNTADLSYLGFCLFYYASACKNVNPKQGNREDDLARTVHRHVPVVAQNRQT